MQGFILIIMKLRFLKKHINWRPGDEANIDDSMAAYMLLCGVVEPADIDNSKTEDILLNHLEENKKINEVKAPSIKKPKAKK